MDVAENRLLHSGRDQDCRNKCTEYNYLQMNRDSQASTKKKMTAAGRRMNNVETTEYSDSQYDDEGQFDAQYPERISIVLTKSNKKRSPSFLFTNGDDRNHIEFEGSDDDPELQSDSNDSDTEKEQWELNSKLLVIREPKNRPLQEEVMGVDQGRLTL
jgi:hypothetical protein